MPTINPSKPNVTSNSVTSLPKSSLQALLFFLTTHEIPFNRYTLPKYVNGEHDNSTEDMILRYEVLFMAAGLKPSVMIGFGDGTSANGKAANKGWINEVWKKTLADIIAGMEAEEPGFQELYDYIKTIRLSPPLRVSVPISDPSGHYLLYPESSEKFLSELLNPSKAHPTLRNGFWAFRVQEKHIAKALGYPCTTPYDRNLPEANWIDYAEYFTNMKRRAMTGYFACVRIDLPDVQEHFKTVHTRMKEIFDKTDMRCIYGSAPFETFNTPYTVSFGDRMLDGWNNWGKYWDSEKEMGSKIAVLERIIGTDCENCGEVVRTGIGRCAGCKSVWYCSKKCQKMAWIAGHAPVCKVEKNRRLSEEKEKEENAVLDGLKTFTA